MTCPNCGGSGKMPAGRQAKQPGASVGGQRRIRGMLSGAAVRPAGRNPSPPLHAQIAKNLMQGSY